MRVERTMPADKIRKVRTTPRCRKCLQEVRIKQVDARNNARIPVLYHCPNHGTLYLQDVMYGQTEDVGLKSGIVGPW